MWQEKENKLYKKYQFSNFSEAFAFMTRVALEAEKMDHSIKWLLTRYDDNSDLKGYLKSTAMDSYPTITTTYLYELCE